MSVASAGAFRIGSTVLKCSLLDESICRLASQQPIPQMNQLPSSSF
jgi:hypothetical protein